VTAILDEPYASQVAMSEMTLDESHELVEQRNNVIKELNIVMRARKPYRRP
jgi:transcription termination factor Rho